MGVYLSDGNEKWMDRDVNISYILTHSNRFDATPNSTSFNTFSDSGNFVVFRQIFENSENEVSETLFSEAKI